jgi:hypothetical protein
LATFVIHVLGRPPQQVTLHARAIRVGRAESSDIVLSGETVSRDHALFTADEFGVWRVGCQSDKNPIVVDGALVTSVAEVKDGSEILIGAEHLLVFCKTEHAANRFMGADLFGKSQCTKCEWTGIVSATRKDAACPKCGNRTLTAAVVWSPKPAGAGQQTISLSGAQAQELFKKIQSARCSRLERMDTKDPERHDLRESERTVLGGSKDAAMKLHGVVLGGQVTIAWKGNRYVAESTLVFPSMAVNGVPAKVAPLKDGDILSVGSNKFRFVTA